MGMVARHSILRISDSCMYCYSGVRGVQNVGGYMTELENPEMRCDNYHRLSVLQPDHCYNCMMRKGYPWYLFGDKVCENFREPLKNGQVRLK
jgi:hypothetical protein